MTVRERSLSGKREEIVDKNILKIRIRIILEVIHTNKILDENEKNLLEYTRTLFLFRRNLGKEEERRHQENLNILKRRLTDVISEESMRALHSLVIDAEEHAGKHFYKNDLPGLYDRIDQRISSL